MAYLPAHLQYIHGNQEIHLKEYSDMKYQSNDQYLLYTRHEDLEQASQKNLRAEIPCWTIFQIHHMWDYKAIYLPSIIDRLSSKFYSQVRIQNMAEGNDTT
ncbi:hypothetical protein CBR20_15020 [Cronobacter sakazakii]|uniref:Uncharacterized protein n=1 Tax=Mixta gaviniae TaxID=665914 RepID=A0A1X1EI31_9GAMM|nr:hypothetical protein LG71_08435 [Pluralibacter gergoviae]AUX94957.1 hypothetical protein C2E15_19035 [Mixta gaviniae]KDP99633.1 hypothetical protein ER21_04345 [Cronobacter sakazakii]PLR45117.1 hypothetical protein CYR40_13900 [Chimaeribacter arupi]AVR02647.1 hypothetical protein A8H26_08055 [Pluralibacter gergoviae]